MKHVVLTLLCVASFAHTYCGEKERKDSAAPKAPLTDQEQIAKLQAQVATLGKNLKNTQDKLQKTTEERDDARRWKERYAYRLKNPRTTPSYGP